MGLRDSIEKVFRSSLKIIIMYFSLGLLNQVIMAEQLLAPFELYMGIVNASSNITFYMISDSVVWAADRYFGDFLISDQYDESQYTADYRFPDYTSWVGWHFVTSQGPGSYPVYGYGLYKFSMDESHYFYLDYRDDRFGAYQSFGDPYGHPADLWIKYDASVYTFYYKNDGGFPWIAIVYGDTLNVWDIKQIGDPTRDRFQPITPSDLTVTWSNNRPLLTWNCSDGTDMPVPG